MTPETALATFSYSYTKTVLTVTATSLLNEVFDYELRRQLKEHQMSGTIAAAAIGAKEG